ncbi:MAG: hypothetical protein KY429_04835 [Actinobacteria bacterium]|nr:hypothetical protein [Actinomycetota bacterium]
MTKSVAIGLLVLLALAGLPLAMGGGAMMTCPSCPPAHSPMMFSICFAVLSVMVAFALTIVGRLAPSSTPRLAILVVSDLLRPPRAL